MLETPRVLSPQVLFGLRQAVTLAEYMSGRRDRLEPMKGHMRVMADLLEERIECLLPR